MYLNARYYDAATARFLSPDPLWDPTKPATLDPYRYADNNPIAFSDPTGLCPGCSMDQMALYGAQTSGNLKNVVNVSKLKANTAYSAARTNAAGKHHAAKSAKTKQAKYNNQKAAKSNNNGASSSQMHNALTSNASNAPSKKKSGNWFTDAVPSLSAALTSFSGSDDSPYDDFKNVWDTVVETTKAHWDSTPRAALSTLRSFGDIIPGVGTTVSFAATALDGYSYEYADSGFSTRERFWLSIERGAWELAGSTVGAAGGAAVGRNPILSPILAIAGSAAGSQAAVTAFDTHVKLRGQGAIETLIGSLELPECAPGQIFGLCQR